MNLLLNNKLIKDKKLLITLAVVLGFILVLVTLQMNITKVSAQIVPVTVSTKNLAFGTVFPGEEIQGNFIVTYVEEGPGIAYKLIQKPKPLPSEHPEYPDGGDPQNPGYYRNLCPFLTKISNEEEGDTEGQAFVGPALIDPSDTWIIYFKVPAIFGHVAQDHTGGVVSENGEYGCDIGIDLIEQFLIDTIIILSDGSVVNSNITLEDGSQYLLEASGTYFYWPSCSVGGGCIADAKYSLRPEGSFNPGPGPKWISGDDLPSPWTNYLEVLVNDTPVAWGIYNSSHIYSINYTGIGSTISFKILDDYYSDNSGSITVKIYQLP